MTPRRCARATDAATRVLADLRLVATDGAGALRVLAAAHRYRAAVGRRAGVAAQMELV